ncbi:hypothetical protein [Viridibacillus arvi]|uniref:hypothetical protein n=1 Tax=Viridibacillus arvi TaxID=263475 RepID=UPI0034CE2522
MFIQRKNNNDNLECNIKEIKELLTENRELLSTGEIDENTYESKERSLLFKLENLFMSKNMNRILF